MQEFWQLSWGFPNAMWSPGLSVKTAKIHSCTSLVNIVLHFVVKCSKYPHCLTPYIWMCYSESVYKAQMCLKLQTLCSIKQSLKRPGWLNSGQACSFLCSGPTAGTPCMMMFCAFLQLVGSAPFTTNQKSHFVFSHMDSSSFHQVEFCRGVLFPISMLLNYY